MIPTPRQSSQSELENAVRGKRVVITGASSGIGRDTSLKLAAAGATTLLVARRQEELAEVQAEITESGGSAHIYPCDLSDTAQLDQLVTTITDEFGSIDILVNNAGRSIRRSVRHQTGRLHDYERTIQINYLAPVGLILGFLPEMIQNKSGQIINVSTLGTQTRPPRYAAYLGSKAALEMVADCMQSELLGTEIRFTTIHMPLVHTPMVAPSGVYDKSPALSSQEAADTICRAIVDQPKRMNSPISYISTFGNLTAPRAVDRLLYAAYRRSAGTKG